MIENAYRDTTSRELAIKDSLKFEDGFDKWITIWEHEYNDNVSMYQNYMGRNTVYQFVDKLNPRDSIKNRSFSNV